MMCDQIYNQKESRLLIIQSRAFMACMSYAAHLHVFIQHYSLERIFEQSACYVWPRLSCVIICHILAMLQLSICCVCYDEAMVVHVLLLYHAVCLMEL